MTAQEEPQTEGEGHGRARVGCCAAMVYGPAFIIFFGWLLLWVYDRMNYPPQVDAETFSAAGKQTAADIEDALEGFDLESESTVQFAADSSGISPHFGQDDSRLCGVSYLPGSNRPLAEFRDYQGRFTATDVPQAEAIRTAELLDTRFREAGWGSAGTEDIPFRVEESHRWPLKREFDEAVTMYLAISVADGDDTADDTHQLRVQLATECLWAEGLTEDQDFPMEQFIPAEDD